MTKKVVISGYYGYGNFGDEAILYTLIQKLKEFDADITVISGNPRFTTVNYYVKAVKNFSFSQVASVIRQSEVLISGGGSLLQDVTSLKSLLYYLWVIWLGIKYKKEVIIFAQGIGPVNNPAAAILTRQLLKRCSYVSVRDENSLNLLKKWGVDAQLVCDPIYSFPLVSGTNARSIGVQLRDFKTMNDDLLKSIAFQILKDFPDMKIEVLSFQDSIDLDVCNRFAQFVRDINHDADISVVSGLTGKSLVSKLSTLDYLIGMRFHSLLLAVKFGIKSAAINYDIKVEKLADEFELPKISMTGENDMEKIFSSMRYESSAELRLKANSKAFDWSGISKIFNK